MGRGSAKAERLLEMERLYLQRAYSDEEIAKRLGVDRTTAYRYRVELTPTCFIVQDDSGRWHIDRKRYISNVRLNLYESLSLYLTARRASQQGHLAGKHVTNALEKLAATLHRPMTEKLVQAAERVLEENSPSEDRIKIFERVAEAWAEERKLRLTYQGLHSSRPYRDTINPYLIEPSPWSDSVYVIGYSQVFDEVSVFKIDRILEAFVSGETFEIPPDFDEERMLKHAWGVWTREGEPQTVRLKFASGPATRRLKESTWHPLEKVTDTEDGGCIWEAPIAEWREMLPWIRQWGAEVTVVAPEELKRHLAGETRRLARLYGWEVHRRGAAEGDDEHRFFDDFFGE